MVDRKLADLCVDTYVLQHVYHLELENYAYNEIVMYLQRILKPYDVHTYRNVITLAEALWQRVGRGKTLLPAVPLEQWIREA